MHLDEEQTERFWSHVDRTGGPDACWPWLLSVNRGGYGRMNVSGRIVLAHRIAWSLAFGEIPEGKLVLHQCPGRHNRSCCNPAHLYIGTSSDNVRDMIEQGTAKFYGGVKTGKDHWSRTHPEQLSNMPRGDQHGSHLHPERILRGADASGAKLNEQIVVEIRKRYALGEHQSKIAARFGVSQACISQIVLGRTWRHIPIDVLGITPSTD